MEKKRPVQIGSLPNKNGRKWGLFKCYCGKVYSTNLYDVEHGKSKSCGCSRKEINVTHGQNRRGVRNFLYERWASMHARCKKHHKNHSCYFDKNISVCKRWKNYQLFKEDMEVGFNKKLTLDRIDNNKGYSKENCRWVDWGIQQNNKSDNVVFYYKGKKRTVSELAKIAGLHYTTMYSRLCIGRKKWTVENAVATPPIPNGTRSFQGR